MVWYIQYLWWCFGISNTCGGVLSNRLGKNRETNEEYDEDCLEDGSQLARVKFGRDGEKDKKALYMGNYRNNI